MCLLQVKLQPLIKSMIEKDECIINIVIFSHHSKMIFTPEMPTEKGIISIITWGFILVI